MPRWLFITIGILGLVGAGWTAVDTVELLNMGFEEGMGIFYFSIIFFLIFGVVFITIGVKKKE